MFWKKIGMLNLGILLNKYSKVMKLVGFGIEEI